mmetsp:Transcript_1933/g.4613  ORF Transcript_1933/g.4613 Transcript_1933/m.4613 type:complete len:214 (+) Transcript_1933:236-877(+)
MFFVLAHVFKMGLPRTKLQRRPSKVRYLTPVVGSTYGAERSARTHWALWGMLKSLPRLQTTATRPPGPALAEARTLSTSSLVIAAHFPTLKPWKAFRYASRFARIVAQDKPACCPSKLSFSNRGLSPRFSQPHSSRMYFSYSAFRDPVKAQYHGVAAGFAASPFMPRARRAAAPVFAALRLGEAFTMAEQPSRAERGPWTSGLAKTRSTEAAT